MALNDYRCALCSKVAADQSEDLTGKPCVSECCEGVMKRVWQFYLKPVQGGGGSPGRSVGG